MWREVHVYSSISYAFILSGCIICKKIDMPDTRRGFGEMRC